MLALAVRLVRHSGPRRVGHEAHHELGDIAPLGMLLLAVHVQPRSERRKALVTYGLFSRMTMRRRCELVFFASTFFSHCYSPTLIDHLHRTDILTLLTLPTRPFRTALEQV